jgi:hypothetical protein
MKNESTYKILIIFFIFLIIKKIVDVSVEIKLPTYKNLKNEPEFWKNMVSLREVLSVFDFIFVVYILIFFKLNKFITIIMLFFLLDDIIYFLIDERLINRFIGQTYNNNIINFIDIYGDMINHIIKFLFCFYVLIYVFH